VTRPDEGSDSPTVKARSNSARTKRGSLRHETGASPRTPLGWARYFGQQPLIDLLETLIAPEPETSDG
jgi:hypothetical protein